MSSRRTLLVVLTIAVCFWAIVILVGFVAAWLGHGAFNLIWSLLGLNLAGWL